MLLDSLTVKVSSGLIRDQEALSAYVSKRPHLSRYTPSTGEIEWTVTMRESKRSDSHGVTVYVGPDIEITGSPARSMGGGNNVFGTLDIVAAAQAHIAAAEVVLGFELPPTIAAYRVTRADVTCNYHVGGLPEVRQVLAYLRQSDGGRYKVASKAETVYWSPGSRRRSGKAYAKGPHLEYQLRRNECSVSPDELALSQGIVRLELKLGSQWWFDQQNPWYCVTAQDFLDEHESYFCGLIGTAEVVDMVDVRAALDELVGRTDVLSSANRVVEVTAGRVAAAHRTWCVIQSVGHSHAKASMPKNTWYVHLKLLNAAGLAWGDLSIGHVSQIRKRPLILSQPVRSWDDLRKVA